MSRPGGGVVLITTSTLPIGPSDGVPRFVLDLGMALSPHLSVVILGPDAPDAPHHEMHGQVRIRRFRYFWPSAMQRLTQGGVLAVNLKGIFGYVQVPMLFLAQLFATTRAIRRWRCDVVNAHWLVPQGLTSAIACAITRTPLVVHVHAGDVYFLQRVPLGRIVARFIVGRATTILADGSHVRDSLAALVGKDVGVQLRPMGVWAERFRPAPTSKAEADPNAIVFVGRLVEKKGLRYLIDAMPLVRTKVPGASLTVIGDGPLREEIDDQIARLNLQGVVRMHGSLGHDSLVSELHRASVACVPSVIDSRGETDGMPTVIIEAMTAGLRVVGTRVNGIPDLLVDRINGWIAEPGDASDLADQLVAAMCDPEGAERARAGMETALVHEWGIVAEEYAGVLRAAAASHRRKL